MRRRRYTPHKQVNASTKACDVPDCNSAGEFRAPKSVNALNDYHWFCLDHVREYNKRWDYFKGLEREQIEAYQQDAVTGHRPTWKREDHFTFTPEGLMSALNHFMNGRATFEKNPLEKPIPKKERDALADLELDAPLGLDELKKHYRKLVKKYHPDLHKGSKTHEERFKRMTGAYAYLQGVYGG